MFTTILLSGFCLVLLINYGEAERKLLIEDTHPFVSIVKPSRVEVNKFEYIQQGVLIHPRAVLTVSKDLTEEELSVEARYTQPMQKETAVANEMRNVEEIYILPEVPEIALLILNQDIYIKNYMNFIHESNDIQHHSFDNCRLVKLGRKEILTEYLIQGTGIVIFGTKQKNVKLMWNDAHGCNSALQNVVDFNSAIFRDYIYCVEEIKKHKCNSNYPGAALVCTEPNNVRSVHLMGLVIGKDKCNWMIVNTPKLQASIEAKLSSIDE